MTDLPFTILDDGCPVAVPVRISGEEIRLGPDAIRAGLGWAVTPDGLCRDAVCVPWSHAAPLGGGDGIDLAELAELLDRPLAVDRDERAAWLGVSAGERAARLAALEAPDFTLPDLQGRLHSLSDQRGKKVLLVVYASW
jgi:hypothetical protein